MSTIQARVRARMRERLDALKGRSLASRKTQSGLAEALGMNPPAVTKMLKAKTPETGLLSHLDTIADYLETTPAELIAKPGSTVIELSPTEQRLLKVWRSYPTEIRGRLQIVLEFFGQLDPDEIEHREWLYELSKITAGQRQALRAHLQNMIREKVGTQGRARGSTPGTPGTKTGTR